MDLKQIKELCKDRDLKTPEVHSSNDFYGHATVLKEYCGIPNDYPIKAAIEHAPTLGDFAWGPDLEAPLPCFFCFSRLRFKTLRARSKKSLFAIGSLIEYANPILSEQETFAEKQRLGRSLLVFPTHSSHHVEVKFDIHSDCREIKKISQNFDSTRICLYWRDVLDGVAEVYQSYGFECTTAGHMFDPLFLRRLRSLIETASVTSAPEGGTSVGYSIALNVPFFFTNTLYSFDARNKADSSALKMEVDKSSVFYDQVKSAFGASPTTEISSSQRALVEELWGLPSRRSPGQMLDLIRIAEDLFNLGMQGNCFNENYLFLKLSDYIRNSDSAKALLAIDELEMSDPDQAYELPVIRAATLIQTGKFAAARIFLEQFLEHNSSHPGALKLLALCK